MSCADWRDAYRLDRMGPRGAFAIVRRRRTNRDVEAEVRAVVDLDEYRRARAREYRRLWRLLAC